MASSSSSTTIPKRSRCKIESPLVTSDPCSVANLGDVRAFHLHLNLTADFCKSEFSGSSQISFQVVGDQAVKKVVLDMRDIDVKSVSFGDKPLKFSVDKAELGQALSVELSSEAQAAAAKKGDEFDILIEYSTSKDASGIQWLPKEQTEGKNFPYLFSQFQAIHARSFTPCQDTPCVKATYSAKITCPKELTALMSALSTSSSEGVFQFEQPIPIPSYLIAIVIGQLESKEIGPRSKVWAEPCVVERAANEFEETEEFIQTAEKFLPPYAWGRYDLLVLPGSFPYGGMENPLLTFVTPTLLAGDRSLTFVVAHEAAHSWSGNLCTNRTWGDFWLNEGFTVFIERKILGRMHGESYRQFASYTGWKDLKDSVDHFGVDHKYTSLVVDIKGIDPDDAFSSIPYEKGSEFLFFLESLVGESEMENFLFDWFKQNAFSTVDTAQFKSTFLGRFDDKPEIAQKLKEKVDWDSWLYSPGMPPVDVRSMYDATLAKDANKLADQWIANGDADIKDISKWSTLQVICFFEKILLTTDESKQYLSADALKKMNEYYKFSSSQNSEIRFRWYQLAIRANYSAVYDDIVSFLKEQGRMKFVRPLYRDMHAHGQETRQLGLNTFKAWKDNYNSIASKMISKDLGLSD